MTDDILKNIQTICVLFGIAITIYLLGRATASRKIKVPPEPKEKHNNLILVSVLFVFFLTFLFTCFYSLFTRLSLNMIIKLSVVCISGAFLGLLFKFIVDLFIYGRRGY